MYYHYEYISKEAGMGELGYLAQMMGYDNVGPILAYPPNKPVLDNGFTPAILPRGVKILIPWHQINLKCLIKFSASLAKKYRNAAVEVIGAQSAITKDIDNKLAIIDAVAGISTSLAGIGVQAATYAKGLKNAVAAAENTAPAGKKLIAWLLDNRATTMVPLVAGGVESPAPPSKGFGFYVRHAFGPWNPSYWGSIVGAASEKNMDIWLYGTSAVDFQSAQRIKQSFDRDIASLTEKISKAAAQLQMPFYNNRA